VVRKAKGRFRVDQDYEEMKGEVGLDHFEGRSWQGWHHHVTLVTLAYAFLMLERMGHKKTSGLTLPAVRRLIQKCLMLYRGICPVCNTFIFDDS
jgi:SRSO17 transposase